MAYLFLREQNQLIKLIHKNLEYIKENNIIPELYQAETKGDVENYLNNIEDDFFRELKTRLYQRNLPNQNIPNN